ncbi:MAG TPA: glycine cleavage T C-terminal barrel domain-containing protein, partial [Thermoanaerobaculia bacterium]|nr:glycine cleavage T C-terminal barrel domain-containing protein [Thermoanaerobaculia bacterium]
LAGRRIARAGAAVWSAGRRVGTVTSGTWTPFLERSIAMALLDSEHAVADGEVEVEVRDRREGARVRKLPFYRRSGG